MRKKLMLYGSCILTLLFATGLVMIILTKHSSHITQENYSKILEGMTEIEVEEIIGLPAGDYSTGSLIMSRSTDPNLVDPEVAASSLELHRESYQAAGAMTWLSDTTFIVIFLDENARVTQKYLLFVELRNGTLIDRLRRWIGI